MLKSVNNAVATRDRRVGFMVELIITAPIVHSDAGGRQLFVVSKPQLWLSLRFRLLPESAIGRFGSSAADGGNSILGGGILGIL